MDGCSPMLKRKISSTAVRHKAKQQPQQQQQRPKAIKKRYPALGEKNKLALRKVKGTHSANSQRRGHKKKRRSSRELREHCYDKARGARAFILRKDRITQHPYEGENAASLYGPWDLYGKDGYERLQSIKKETQLDENTAVKDACEGIGTDSTNKSDQRIPDKTDPSNVATNSSLSIHNTSFSEEPSPLSSILYMFDSAKEKMTARNSGRKKSSEQHIIWKKFEYAEREGQGVPRKKNGHGEKSVIKRYASTLPLHTMYMTWFMSGEVLD